MLYSDTLGHCSYHQVRNHLCLLEESSQSSYWETDRPALLLQLVKRGICRGHRPAARAQEQDRAGCWAVAGLRQRGRCWETRGVGGSAVASPDVVGRR